jgi:phytoene desaturase
VSGRRAAVVGSGFGGLGMAIRLQAAGVQTTLVDRRDQPGGRAYVYRDQGFTFDAGPTVITAPGALEELFASPAPDAGPDRDDSAGRSPPVRTGAAFLERR